MSTSIDETPASTTEAASAMAQSRGDSSSPPQTQDEITIYPGEDQVFSIGPRVFRAVHAMPYERKPEDPLYRPLRIFALDPAVSRLNGAVALVNVPYEPLEPGPSGKLFKVDNYDPVQQTRYKQVQLDEWSVLIRNGRTPSPSDPQFHQQMVYAVCSLVYAAFRTALGRHIAWGFNRKERDDCHPGQLLIRPFGMKEMNAFYDKENGELCFGYYQAGEKVGGLNLPHGYIFTALSHDIIAHEVTHALLDGLRAHFAYPSSTDVPAFHEAFADLVAVFQHFSYGEVVRSAIRESRGNLSKAHLLTGIASQFGHTSERLTETDIHSPLRTVIDNVMAGDGPGKGGERYDANCDDPHAHGSMLASAVFDAFVTIFERKCKRYIRLATNGTGLLPDGELQVELQEILADKASKLASQILTILIRAIDYCPPVDIEFGEYLRAIITADHDLVQDDPWGYREAFTQAFAERGIYPTDVESLTDEAILWRSPSGVPPIPDLTFARLQFEGDPGRPASPKELRRQACVLGRFVTRPEHLDLFGLAAENDPRLRGDRVDLPVIESIRSSRRAGPDGQIVFDLVAEVLQRRVVQPEGDSPGFDFYGGATIILSPNGEIRYVIRKSVASDLRLQRQRAFITSAFGKRLWDLRGRIASPHKSLFRLIH